MMKRFAKEIHRDIEREKDTLMRCRKDMQEQKAYIDSAKSDNERKVHEIMYKQQCSFERTVNFSDGEEKHRDRYLFHGYLFHE